MLARLFSYRSLFAISALFIVYATTIPWRLRWPPEWSADQWIPFWDPDEQRVHPVPDMVRNVILFVPFGFFGWLALRRVVKVTLLGTAVSASVELLQTVLHYRQPRTTDILTNTGGAYLGALVATLLAGPVEGKLFPWLNDLLRRRPGMLALLALTAGLVWTTLAPFYPPLDAQAFSYGARPPLAQPAGAKPPALLLFDALIYAGFTTVWLRETRLRLAPWLLAGALELVQFLVPDSAPSLRDLGAAWTGVAIGELVALRAGRDPAQRTGELSLRYPALCYGFALGLVVLRALEPFRVVEWEAPGFRSFVPFYWTFRRVHEWTIANFLGSVAVYLPLAHVMLVRGRGVVAATATCFGLAFVLEVCQIPLENRAFDITEPLLAAGAALAVARAHELWTVRSPAHSYRLAL
jgi:glycopeptide antibiotics resistance protein